MIARLLLCVALAGCDACEPDPPASPGSERDRGDEGVRALVAGGELRCLLGATGWVRCHGPGGDELSDALEDVAHLAINPERGCAVHRDGSVVCWETGGEPAEVTGITDARAVAVGAEHACVLDAAGGVRCWGDNRRGQLGDGTTEDRDEPVSAEGLPGVAQIAAGDAHTCALLQDGAVRCWGGHARVEDVAREPRTPEELVELMPRPVVEPAVVPSLDGVERIAAGTDATCAVTAGRRVVCWPGYLGAGATPSALAWPDDALHVAVGEWGKCAVRAGGAAVCWDFAADDGSGRQVAPVAVRGVTGALEVAVGANGACARGDDARVRCWSTPESVTVLGSRDDSR